MKIGGKRKRKYLSILSKVDSNSDSEDDEEEDSKNSVEVQDNHVYFYTDVNSKSIQQLVRIIRKLNVSLGTESLKFDLVIKIYLHINSDGGDIFSALAGVDTILNSKIPIVTIVEGGAASAATMLSIVGSERWIHKHAHMLVHQLRSNVWGTMAEIKEEMGNLERLMTVIKDLYTKYTKIKKDKLDNILKHDIWWSSKKCLKKGLVDKII